MNESTKPSISVPTVIRSRRDVLKGAGTALAALALTAASPMVVGRAFASEMLQAQLVTDIDILNFVLSLEYVQAGLYGQAVAGGQLSGTALTYLTTIRDHEIAHVNELTRVLSVLGGTPVQAVSTYNFGNLSTQAAILAVAQNVEEVCVGAYTGTARLFTDKTQLLAAAAGIEQVEARHTAVIRYLRNQQVASSAYGPLFTADEVNVKIDAILGR